MRGRSRLYSSNEVIRVLERDGFRVAKDSKRGSHRTFRKVTDGRTIVAVVPLSYRELPRGTFASILRQAGITMERFLEMSG